MSTNFVSATNNCSRYPKNFTMISNYLLALLFILSISYPKPIRTLGHAEHTRKNGIKFMERELHKSGRSPKRYGSFIFRILKVPNACTKLYLSKLIKILQVLWLKISNWTKLLSLFARNFRYGHGSKLEQLQKEINSKNHDIVIMKRQIKQLEKRLIEFYMEKQKVEQESQLSKFEVEVALSNMNRLGLDKALIEGRLQNELLRKAELASSLEIANKRLLELQAELEQIKEKEGKVHLPNLNTIRSFISEREHHAQYLANRHAEEKILIDKEKAQMLDQCKSLEEKLEVIGLPEVLREKLTLIANLTLERNNSELLRLILTEHHSSIRERLRNIELTDPYEVWYNKFRNILSACGISDEDKEEILKQATQSYDTVSPHAYVSQRILIHFNNVYSYYHENFK